MRSRPVDFCKLRCPDGRRGHPRGNPRGHPRGHPKGNPRGHPTLLKKQNHGPSVLCYSTSMVDVTAGSATHAIEATYCTFRNFYNQ